MFLKSEQYMETDVYGGGELDHVQSKICAQVT